MTVVQQGNGHLVANARVFDWSLLVKFFLSHLRQKPPICFGFDLSLPFSFLYTKTCLSVPVVAATSAVNASSLFLYLWSVRVRESV